MADDAAAAERSFGRLWPENASSQDPIWTDDRDEDTVPLLEGENGQLLNADCTLDWPGPWNTQEINPFKVEDWKPPPNLLLEGDNGWNTFVDIGCLLNNPINVTPISKPRKSANLFEEKVEPGLKPSHTGTAYLLHFIIL